MKRLLVALWIAAGPMSGCLASPPVPTLQVTLRLSPTPALIGPTRLIIEVTDVGGDPVAGAAVSVEGLPDRGTEREATTRDAVEEGAGRYVVPGFDLDVGGPWTLMVTTSSPNGSNAKPVRQRWHPTVIASDAVWVSLNSKPTCRA